MLPRRLRHRSKDHKGLDVPSGRRRCTKTSAFRGLRHSAVALTHLSLGAATSVSAHCCLISSRRRLDGANRIPNRRPPAPRGCTSIPQARKTLDLQRRPPNQAKNTSASPQESLTAPRARCSNGHQAAPEFCEYFRQTLANRPRDSLHSAGEVGRRLGADDNTRLSATERNANLASACDPFGDSLGKPVWRFFFLRVRWHGVRVLRHLVKTRRFRQLLRRN